MLTDLKKFNQFCEERREFSHGAFGDAKPRKLYLSSASSCQRGSRTFSEFKRKTVSHYIHERAIQFVIDNH